MTRRELEGATGAPVSLEKYALVLGAMDEGEPLDVALEIAVVPERAWPAGEAEHVERLSRAAADPSLLEAFDAAMRGARAALARPVIPLDRDIAAWARWLAAWSASADPARSLAAAGMRAADVHRLSSLWTERMSAERALAERFAEEMQRPGPAPEVRVETSPRVAAAREAVRARASAVTPQEPSPAHPPLVGPLPGELSAAPSSFIASGPGEGPPPLVHRVAPKATQPIAAAPASQSAPLPFDPAAPGAVLPSQGPQRQSGLTDDVDLSAVVRKVLAFGQGPPASAPPIPSPRTAEPPPVAPPPVAPPPVAPLPVAPSPVAPPPMIVSPSPIGETAAVDVGALARKVLAFEPASKSAPPAPAQPPAASSSGSQSTAPARAAQPAAPPLTLEQYASLCVDLELYPAQAADVLRRYSVSEAARRALDEGWRRIFDEQPGRRAAFEQAKITYRAWLARGGRR